MSSLSTGENINDINSYTDYTFQFRNYKDNIYPAVLSDSSVFVQSLILI